MQKINTEIYFEFPKYRRLIMWWGNRQKRARDIRIRIFIGLIPTIGIFIAYWYMGSRNVLLENNAGIFFYSYNYISYNSRNIRYTNRNSI